MSNQMSGSTKAVLAVVAVIAIVIPIALGFVLLNGPPALPSSTTAASSATSASSSTSSGGGGPGPSTVTIPNGAGNGPGNDHNFSPASLTVAAGTTITFMNADTAVHNVDFTNVPSGSAVAAGTTSPNLKNGATYTVTLTTPGTYTYVCDFHNWMKATITVTG